MYDSPTSPATTPTESPTQNTPNQTPAAAPKPSEKLAIWSLILGISAIVLALIVFISIPAAIVAIVLGAMALVKHSPGKTKAIVGIITGGAALLIFIPASIALSFVVFEGIAEKAEDLAKTTDKALTAGKTSDSTNSSMVTGNKVSTDCYSFTIPSSYEYDEDSVDCTTIINIPKGDILTRITVRPNTGKIGTLNEVVNTLNASIKKSDPSNPGITTQEELTINGRLAYHILYKDGNGLLSENYIIPDDSASQTINGKTITAYSVVGYGLPQVKEVAESLILK